MGEGPLKGETFKEALRQLSSNRKVQGRLDRGRLGDEGGRGENGRGTDKWRERGDSAGTGDKILKAMCQKGLV